MMNKMYIKIEGMNLSRLINKIASSGICITELKIKHRMIKFCVDERYYSQLKLVCKKEHKKCQVISRSGIKNLLFSLKYSLGAVLAVVIAACYLWTFNGIIFELNVGYSSNLVYDIKKVQNVLDEYGIKEGAALNYKTSEIEKFLMLNVDDISGCSVIKNGSYLDICVYPEIKNNVLVKELVAKYDAIITEINVYSGKTNYKVGDIVKKGDVLISSDEEAAGIVKGKVYFSEYEIYNEVQQQLIKTGNYYTNKTIKLNNKILYKQAKNNKYSKYLTEKCVFYINDNFFLPLKCEEEFVFEAELNEVIIPFEENEIILKERLINKLQEKIGEGFKEDDITFSIVRDGYLVRLDCYYQADINLF